MKRRTFLKKCGAVAAGLAFSSAIANAGVQIANDRLKARIGRRRPNIVYILADDLGISELGCYGQTKIKTPNIDKLAAEGMKFSQHYSGSSVCAPTRCTIMTGQHTGHCFTRNNGNKPLPDNDVTVAELMKEAGYATGAMGKWGLGLAGTTGEPNDQGFDHWFGYLNQARAHNFYPTYVRKNKQDYDLDNPSFSAHQTFPAGLDSTDPANYERYLGNEYSNDLMLDEAVDFITTNKNRPFFLYLAFTISHVALQVPADSLAQYEGKFPETPYSGSNGYLPHWSPRACYAAMVTRLDGYVKTVMDLLKQFGLDDDTLVVFTSDNGPTFNGGTDSAFFESAKPFRGLKGSLYEGGIRAPMIARWPGKIKPSSTTDHISAQWDVLPTMADIAGVKAPGNIDGLSFLPTLLSKTAQQQHEYLFWELGSKMAVRKGDYKAVWNNVKTQQNPTIALYNLSSDIAESTNVASSNPTIVSEMEQIRAQAHVYSPEFPILYSEVNG